MEVFASQLNLPDLWQQSALRALQSGRDVIVSAPTGAGKTFIFELLIESGFKGQAIYTVPTRALANDKRREWQQRGWNVGICTGDRVDKLEAPVVVATLETQKQRLLNGTGPDLLVLDEYQMLGDHQRGLNYELAICSAPAHTQMLFFSGSVGNPEQIVRWLQRLGRSAELIQHLQRPVPLDEVFADALPDNVPASVRGLWPRTIARALKAGMAPLLAFAPRRKAAEELALDLARMLPEEDPIILTPEQQQLAGPLLTRLLKARVAFHHSGLDYRQRAGLIEPLAKAGQLRAVVATMGLAAGINFSMRSVIVTDREYRSGDHTHEVRPDELLQMFGRAGRRGMDKVGFIITVPGKPRLREAKPLRLKRSNQIDWPSILGVMQHAIGHNRDPLQAARKIVDRLFSSQRIALGLENFTRATPAIRQSASRITSQAVVEIQTPDGGWERQRAPRKAPLADAWYRLDGKWLPALQLKLTLNPLPVGTLCRIYAPGQPPQFGRQLPVARFGKTDKEGECVLNRGLLKLLRAHPKLAQQRWLRFNWQLSQIEQRILPLLPLLTFGGTFLQWHTVGDSLYAQLDYSHALTRAYVDSSGRALINPLERTVHHEVDLAMPEVTSHGNGQNRSAADIWFQLGLIDAHAAPTQRGILFSFFNYGEGLAIAAALEDASYPIADLIHDLANLRAGHRFGVIDNSSSRMGAACRAAFGMATYPGYLLRGVPATYGEGAAEFLFADKPLSARQLRDTELRSGDIERARMEWRSLLRHIANAPFLNWERWLQLRDAARHLCDSFPQTDCFEDLPPLTQRQKGRHRSFLQFDHPQSEPLPSE